MCDFPSDLDAVCFKSLAAARGVKGEPAVQDMEMTEVSSQERAAAAPRLNAGTAENLDDILAEPTVSFGAYDDKVVEMKPPATKGGGSDLPVKLPAVLSFADSRKKITFSGSVRTRHFVASPHECGDGVVAEACASTSDPILRTTDQHFQLLGSHRMTRGKDRFHNPWVSSHERKVAPGTLELVQVKSPQHWSLPNPVLYELRGLSIGDISTDDSVMFTLGTSTELLDDDTADKAAPLFSFIGEFSATTGGLTITHPTPADAMSVK